MIIDKDQDNNIATKTIGLISDTHIPSRATTLPKEIFTIFKNADYIIHAGDIVELSVIDELEQIAPVLAVHGNMDSPEAKNALPELNSLKIFSKKIGVIHNPNILYGMDSMRELTKTNQFDILVYGHTHNANIKWEEKTLYINPGSPTSPSSLLNKPSVAILKITQDKTTPEIIYL
ncbi:MAG: metallophosphoesterase [Nitrososphaerota archaeon]|jgi:putative phosphoesterase|nr:metallophosphoesterase [Nitrososphaerota archaeon]